jgi:salicylate hydroxylase
MPAPPLPSVVIVGGGVGGLTAALACRLAGLDVEIYEQASALEPVGAGIQLTPNATRILRALNALQPVARHGFYPQAAQFRAARSGYIIGFLPLGEFAEARYGAPYIHVHRDDLQRGLLEAVAARRIPLHLGKTFEDYTQHDSKRQPVEVRFSDGSSTRCDLLVGADGIKSGVRDRTFGARAPVFSGHLAWRGLVPADRLPANAVPPNVTAWLGPQRHFVHYYVRGGSLVNFVGVVETERWTEESWSIEGDPAELQRDFAGWHPVVEQLIGAAQQCYKWALYDRDPLERWSRGRVTLLGDACHPMRPFLAQGAAMAIEDAWVLGRMLELYEDEVEQALTEYDRYRIPRTRYVQQQSRLQGEMYHLSEPIPRLLRNVKLALGSRFLPDVAMKRFDWLFAYDAVRGFD